MTLADDPRAPADPVLGEAPRRVMKTAEGVALEIVHDIVTRGLKKGDRLPLETAMVRQYQVSRVSLREALRILEVQGLISLKPGPGGGPTVGAVDPRFLARTQALYFHLSGANYRDLFSAHVLLEPLCAELAAGHPDRRLVRQKMSPYVGDDHALEGPGYWKETSGFHEAIFDLSDNRVLSLITRSIGQIVFDHVMAGMEPVHLRGQIVEEHSMIARAVVHGQKQRAARLMREHNQGLLRYYEETWPWRFNDLIEWR